MRQKAKDMLLARIPLQRGPKETVWLEFPHAELAHRVREGAWMCLLKRQWLVMPAMQKQVPKAVIFSVKYFVERISI